jgi:hypothetical protein
MMTYLRLIEQCETGKEEGSIVCYNTLRLREKGVQAEEVGEDRSKINAEYYLQTVIQQTMNEIVSSEDVLRKLGANDEALDQKVHQSKYVTNMIGKECGMNSLESLDPHGGWTCKEIRSQKREVILQLFFKEFAKRIVKGLQDNFNSATSAQKQKNYNMFIESFEGIDYSTLQEMWDYSEGLNLTEFGAIHLLKNFGYIEADLSKYEHYLRIKHTLNEALEELEDLKRKSESSSSVVGKKRSLDEPEEEKPFKKVSQEEGSSSGLAGKKRSLDESKDEHLPKKVNKEVSLVDLKTREIEELNRQLIEATNSLQEVEMEEELPAVIIPDRILTTRIPADILRLKDRWESVEAKLGEEKSLMESLQKRGLADEVKGLELSINDLKEKCDAYKGEYELAYNILFPANT